MVPPYQRFWLSGETEMMYAGIDQMQGVGTSHRGHSVSRRALYASAVLCVAFVAACGSNDKPTADATSSGVASGTTSASAEAAKPATTALPLTLDSTAAAVAVSDRGVYVADSGEGNETTVSGSFSSSDEGRIVLLEPGSNVQKDVVKVVAPTGMAVGPDGSLYVLENKPMHNRVVKFPSGSTTPVPLPFPTEFPGPENIAVDEAGNVVVLYESSIQTLPGGEPTATAATTDLGGRVESAFAVSRDGAVYFIDGSDAIMVLDKGASSPKTFAESVHDRLKAGGIVAMTVDENGDVYVLDRAYECNGMCEPAEEAAAIFTLHKFAGGSSTPIAIPVTGLKSPTSIAVGNGDIYIADGNGVVKLARQ